MTATELKKRAIALAEKTKIDSVTPEEVGQLSNDIVEYIENVEINGSSLGIRKTYTSVSAMEADSTAPKDDKGVLLRRGMLVNIYNQSDPDSADNGKVFSFQNPGWAFRGTVDAGYATKEELTELSNNVGLYNVDKNVPLGSGFYTSTTARAAVPSSVRKLGLIITYKTDATTSVTEQFIGSAVSAWATDTNWKNLGSEGGNKILEWNTDAATTRKQVPANERKAGMQISYKNPDGDWINEQYIATTNTTDKEWVKDSNWKVVDDKFFFVEWNTDVSTTRKQLFTSFRKKGSILTYTHPTYGKISEIYIGEYPTIESYWVQDKYWFRLSNYYFQVIEWNTDNATTRKSVPIELRKFGMVLMYENPTKVGKKDFIIEQYVGEINVSNELYWSSDENWVRILNSNFTPVLESEFQTCDFAICDEKGNIIVMFKDGHIKTKNFDSNSQVFKDLSFIADMPTTDICIEPFNSYVGDNIQIFKYPISLIRNYRDFVVNIAPLENKNATFRNLERYAEIQPKSAGTIKMQVQLMSNMGRLGVSKDFSINVLQPQNPASAKNVLVIGDSEVEGITNNTGQNAVNTDKQLYPFTTELKGLLSDREGDDITPAGLNLSNIKLIGSRNTELGRHDGIGGWTADMFLTNTSSPFYVNGEFNFTSYLDQDKIYDDVSHKGVDIMYVLLGANNNINQIATGNGWTYNTSTYKSQMIRLLDFIKTDILTVGKTYYNPNFKLVLINYAFPWLYGNSYHPYGISIDGDGTKNARKYYQIHLANKELANMDEYRSFVSAALIAPFIDSENCYAAIEKSINKRMTTKELIIVENVHPIKEGYQLYAEGVLRDLIGRI